MCSTSVPDEQNSAATWPANGLVPPSNLRPDRRLMTSASATHQPSRIPAAMIFEKVPRYMTSPAVSSE